MPLSRLRSDDAILILVDAQERPIARAAEGPRLANNLSVLLEVAAATDVPCLLLEIDPQREGRTLEPLSALVGDPSARIERHRIGAAGVDIIRDEIHRRDRHQAILAGPEASRGIVQTGLDLLANGRQVFLPEDAIDDLSPIERRAAMQRLDRSGATCGTIRMFAWELLADLRHPRREMLDGALQRLVL